MIILIDGDVLCYRAACSPIRLGYIDKETGKEAKRGPTEGEAIGTLKSLVIEVLEGASGKDSFSNIEHEMFLTGKGNFRNDYAVTAPYKGNRKEVEKPEHLEACRGYMRLAYKTKMSSGEEADDLLGIRSTQLGPDVACVASTDKDMLQLNCWHYNITRKDLIYVEPFEGLRWFYGQLIEGDRADNIKGVHGIGPKKREKILAECTTEHDLHFMCVETFMNTGLSSDESQARVLENGRLAWLRREQGQIWSPFEWAVGQTGGVT